MNKELVEKLKNKDYVREFGRMSEEERELYKKVGARNCVRYSSVLSICGWYDAFDFCERFSYAIKSDYQPEPEYEDVEIVNTGRLGIYTPKGRWTNLHEIPSMPNFDIFVYGMNHAECKYQNIAKEIRSGKKVMARFVKE
jgi:hypothetical protein